VENSVTAAVVEVVVVEFNVAFARAWKSSNVAWSGGLMAKTIPIFNNKRDLTPMRIRRRPTMAAVVADGLFAVEI